MPPPPILLKRPTGLDPLQALKQRYDGRRAQIVHIGKSAVRKRVRLTDLRSKVVLELPSNPETLKLKTVPTWTNAVVRGLGYEPSGFQNTKNMTVQLKFILDGRRLHTDDQDGPSAVLSYLAFLHSLCYPENPSRVSSVSTAPILKFEWPGVISMECGVTDFETETLLWTHEGTPLPLMQEVSMDLEERRKARIYASDIAGASGVPGRALFHTEMGTTR